MKKHTKIAMLLGVLVITGAAGTALESFSQYQETTKVQAEDTNRISFGDVIESTEDEEDAEEADASDDDLYTLPNVKAITKKVMPSIVAITNVEKETIQLWGREFEQDSESTGSGIIVAQSEDELLIATNNHVVENSDDLTVLFSVDVENEEDKLVSAQVKGTDSSLDLAVVAVKLSDIPKDVKKQISVAELGDSDSVQVGDWAIAIGNALGYGQSVTFGIISALDREVSLSTDNGTISNNMIQTDAAINFGNSGGALLDENGRLIGINSAKAASDGVEGMGYAIPINTAKPIIEDLMNQTTRSKVDEEKAGALGVKVTNVSEEARQLYNIPAGAYVYELTSGGAAEEAGMKEGDVITKLDKTGISSMNELLERIQYYEAGETVDVTVKRMGENGYEEKVLQVTLQAKADLNTGNDSNSSQDYYDDEDSYDDNSDENSDDESYNNLEDFFPKRSSSDNSRFGFFG
ncbi:MAG: S1C family serine protease [Muricoprocola sp.]